MDINLGDERIVELRATYAPNQIRGKALVKRAEAFGQIAKLFQRPKPEDIEIVLTQQRYEPFWVASASAHYSYDRQHTYRVDASPEVRAVTILGQRYEVANEHDPFFELPSIEHCEEKLQARLTLNAVDGTEADVSKYLDYPKVELASAGDLEKDGAMVVPPEIRSSFVVRNLVSKLMRTFQADRIYEERIDVEEIALYYRPVYAVEYEWKAKNKRQVFEFDALTGESRAEAGVIKKHAKRILDMDALFDIGSDTAGMLVPGGGVAVKLGRLAVRKALR